MRGAQVFLGILPANNNFEEWKQEAQKHRRRFEQLRQVHMIDPYKEVCGGGEGVSFWVGEGTCDRAYDMFLMT